MAAKKLKDYLPDSYKYHKGRIWDIHKKLKPFVKLSETDLYEDWSLDMFEELLIFTICFADSESEVSSMGFDEKINTLSKLSPRYIREEAKDMGFRFRNMLTAYFRVFYNSAYEEWISLRIAIANFNHYVRRPITDADKPEQAARAQVSVAKELSTLKARLNMIEMRLLGSEEAAKAVAEEEGSEYLGGFAEQFAQEYRI